MQRFAAGVYVRDVTDGTGARGGKMRCEGGWARSAHPCGAYFAFMREKSKGMFMNSECSFSSAGVTSPV